MHDIQPSARPCSNSLLLTTPRDEGITKKEVVARSGATISLIDNPISIQKTASDTRDEDDK